MRQQSSIFHNTFLKEPQTNFKSRMVINILITELSTAKA